MKHTAFPVSLAIVGNGGGELGKQSGARIDSFSAVARFTNFAAHPIPAADYGTRTTFWVTAFHPDESPPDRSQIRHVFSPIPIGNRELWPSVYKWNYEPLYEQFKDITTVMPFGLFQELWKLQERPTTGFAFLWWYRRTMGFLSRAQVFGFDGFKPGAPVHYWDSEVCVGEDCRANHHVQGERSLFSSLFNDESRAA